MKSTRSAHRSPYKAAKPSCLSLCSHRRWSRSAAAPSGQYCMSRSIELHVSAYTLRRKAAPFIQRPLFSPRFHKQFVVPKTVFFTISPFQSPHFSFYPWHIPTTFWVESPRSTFVSMSALMTCLKIPQWLIFFPYHLVIKHAVTT